MWVERMSHPSSVYSVRFLPLGTRWPSSHAVEGTVMSELSNSLMSTHSWSSWYLWTQGRVEYNNSTDRKHCLHLAPFHCTLSTFIVAVFLQLACHAAKCWITWSNSIWTSVVSKCENIKCHWIALLNRLVSSSAGKILFHSCSASLCLSMGGGGVFVQVQF